MPLENRRIQKLLRDLFRELDREFYAELSKRMKETKQMPLRKAGARKISRKTK